MSVLDYSQDREVDHLWAKIKVLNETLWEQQANKERVEDWLSNFDEGVERKCALFLLSQFMYFGLLETRVLLKELYYGLFKYPLAREFRRHNANTTDVAAIEHYVEQEIQFTRFLGVGNASESGPHLLYYLRQVTGLPKGAFIHGHEIFRRSKPKSLCRRLVSGSIRLRDPEIRHYVFVDDLCGSGSQAIAYNSDLIIELKRLNKSAKAYYFMLFGTQDGINEIRRQTSFDRVEAVVELDTSYKVFDGDRYFTSPPTGVSKDALKALCQKYGHLRYGPYGYKDGQLLLAFHYNTPDNTLPIVSSVTGGWQPIFRRYDKVYS